MNEESPGKDAEPLNDPAAGPRDGPGEAAESPDTGSSVDRRGGSAPRRRRRRFRPDDDFVEWVLRLLVTAAGEQGDGPDLDQQSVVETVWEWLCDVFPF